MFFCYFLPGLLPSAFFCFLLLFFAGDKDDDVGDEETEKQLSTDFASFYKAMNYDYVVPAGAGTA